MKKKKKIKIGVSGNAGSFSEEAGLLYAEREMIPASIVPVLDMEGVLHALDQGSIDLGVFPVVNSQGGLVRQAFTAMGKHLFIVIDELWLEVQQCLLVQRGAKRDEIKQFASHPQAIIQCQRYIKRAFPRAKTLEWSDTATAAADLAAGKFPRGTAVIASARAAQIYNLEILERGIQDMHPNLTTFIIVKK